MKSFIRLMNAWVCAVFTILITGITAILSLISIIFNPNGNLSFRITKLWSKSILLFCRVKIETQGIENISKDRIQIFASNHVSMFDIIALTSIIPVKFGWIAKKELFKIPIMGWHMKANNYISVDRSNTRDAVKSLSEAAEQVKNGKRVVIFPEGTRSEDGELQPFKKGLFHICAKTGVPVLPIYIEGTHNILKMHSLHIHPGKVKIIIGSEIHTTGHSRENIKTLMNDLKESMIQLQGQARSPINTEKE